MTSVYSKFKIFRYPEKLATLLASWPEITAPLHVRIKPINRCNHHCCYCAYRNARLQIGSNMNDNDAIPRDKMFEIIEDLVDMGIKAVTFSGGGEPLLYPHMEEVVERLAASDIRFASLTNGSLLRGRIAELFSRHATWLRVSMDGWDDESYATYRGVKVGEYKKILCNIRNFKRLGGACRLGVCINIDNKNHDHVLGQLRQLKDCGVDSVKLSPCIVSNSGEVNNRFHAPFFAGVREQLDMAKLELEDGNFNIYDSYHMLEECFDKAYDWCPYMQILTVIGADCGVYACQDKAYSENGFLGSIANIGFKEFWHSNKELFFSINPSKHCHHHCVSNGKNLMVCEYLNIDSEHGQFV